MDLVVRTPHGDADLTLDAWESAATMTSTVADLVEMVTGQASPPLVDVDGRPIPASTLLRDAPILVGSVISSHPATTLARGANAVRLLQLTGRGAGTVRSLEPGTYRIGPGRRRFATELADAPVEQPLVEITVSETPSGSAGGDVTVQPIAPARALLDGVELDGPVAWATGQLRIGQRLFGLDRREDAERQGRDRFRADPDGTIQFSRSPQLTHDDSNMHIVDSIGAAQTLGTSLWSRRTGPSGALVLPFGFVDEELVDQPLRPAVLTIEHARPAAITGPPAFRDAVARTLLLAATTRYGPVDLSLVIATRPEHLGDWDWAKWLPHLGVGAGLFSRPAELRRWTASMSPTDPMTLLVLDDADLWSRNESPLRDLLAVPPANLLTLALADRVDRAPAATTSIIRHESDERCRLIGTGRSMAVVPSLVEADIAAATAQALAPLRDSELPAHDERPTITTPPVTFVEAVDALMGQGPSPSTPVIPLGTSASGDPLNVPWETGTTWSVAGSDPDDVTTTALVVLLSLAVGSDPTTTPIVVVGPTTSAVSEIVERLPHFGGRCDDIDEQARTRLLAGLARHLDAGGAAVVAVEAFHDAHRAADRTAFMTQLRTLTDRHPLLRLLDVSNGGESTGLSSRTSDLVITIDRRSHTRRALAEAADGEFAEWFTPFSPVEARPAASVSVLPSGTSSELSANPFVFGRQLSPLERRLERVSVAMRSFDLDPATTSLIDAIGRAHQARTPDATPQLVPPSLPATVSLEALLVANEADAVPIGLADDPSRERHEVVWWQPGVTGSMLFIGTPRSGIDVALTALTVGIRERFGSSDLTVYAIDASNRRLNAVGQLPNVRGLASLERLDKVAQIVDDVVREVLDRRARQHAGQPSVLLMIGDLTQLGRRLRDSSYSPVLDRLLVAASGADVGVNIVATASRSSDSCGLSDVVDRTFVGALSSAADAAAVGFDLVQLVGLEAGRCRELGTGRLVQLAAAPPDVRGRPTADARSPSL